jgi:hypothetical protein
MAYLGAWMVNSAAHDSGIATYCATAFSTNKLLRRADNVRKRRHWPRWFEFASTCRAIKALSFFGLARNVNLPTRATMDRQALRKDERSRRSVNSTQIAAYVVSGIGFLAGGVIFKERLSISGLNTAATMWCTAAVGALVGYGFLVEAAIGVSRRARRKHCVASARTSH